MSRSPHPHRNLRTRRSAVALSLLLSLGTVACGASGSDQASGTTRGQREAAPSTTTTRALPPPTTLDPPCTHTDGPDGPSSVVARRGCDIGPVPTTVVGTETTTTTGVETTPTTEVEADGDRQAYVDALSSSFRSESTLSVPVDASTAACIAEVWVDELTVEGLAGAGVSPDDLAQDEFGDELAPVIDRQEAETMVAALGGCGLDVDAILGSIAGGSDAEQTRCVVDALPDGFVEGLLVTALDQGSEALSSNDALLEPLTDAVEACR